MKIKQAVKSFAALAQNSRLKIFRLLVWAGPQGVAAGEIAEGLQIAPATLSFHLKDLSAAGLIRDRREGRRIIYSPDVEGIQELLNYLVADCCNGAPELCAPLLVQIETGRKRARR